MIRKDGGEVGNPKSLHSRINHPYEKPSTFVLIDKEVL
jgi:hypothetical protein